MNYSDLCSWAPATPFILKLFGFFLIEEICHKDDTYVSSILVKSFFILINPSFISFRADAKNLSILKIQVGVFWHHYLITNHCYCLLNLNEKNHLKYLLRPGKTGTISTDESEKPQYKTQGKSSAPLAWCTNKIRTGRNQHVWIISNLILRCNNIPIISN